MVELRSLDILKDKIPSEVMNRLAKDLNILSEPSRLNILLLLAVIKEMNVNELSFAINLSPSAVSHQLKILRDGGFVKFRKKGKEVCYSMFDEDMVETANRLLEDLKKRISKKHI